MSSSNKYYNLLDPIQCLRKSWLSSKGPKQKQKLLYFDKQSRLPLKTATAWLNPSSQKQYSLGSLWLFLECKDKDKTQYLMKSSDLDVEMVNIADREDIIKYFTGQVQETHCINQELKMQLMMAATNKSHKREQPIGGFNQNQHDHQNNKKQQIPWDLKVIDYVLKYQRPTGSKTRSLRCPTQTFNFFLDILRQKAQPVVSLGKSRLNRIYQKKKCPIIIVPQSFQAGSVSLSNIQKLLSQGIYQQPKMQSKSIQRKLQLQHTIKQKKIIFQITNNASILSLADWENVVCVFVNGSKTEFSSWAIRDPQEIFKKAKGYLLKYQDITAKYDANDWNIKTVVVDRNARYRDEEIRKRVWNDLQHLLFEKS